MPELRQNLATREWVIVSPERLKGGQLQKKPNVLMDTHPEHSLDCPFCAGNEDRFDNVEIDRIVAPDSDGEAESPWIVRCIENKYKILEQYDSCPVVPTEFDHDGIYCRSKGCGNHELVLESPLHNSTFATMSQRQVEQIIGMYIRRLAALRHNPNNLVTILFKNHGVRSGASQIHPHTQILAMRVVPNYLRFILDEATRYFDSNGICVFCKMLQYELDQGDRLVYQNERFVAYVPYAASVPYEIHIFPKVHDALFGDMSDDEAALFSDCLKISMQRLYKVLSNPDFNLVMRNPPYALSGVPFYHWYLRVVPFTNAPGGFELGSRIRVNVVSPEQAAADLRAAE